MEDIVIKNEQGAFFTPNVNFSASTGKCILQGESYLEDSFEFYANLTRWMEQYLGSGKSIIEVDFKLTYFNTSSSRAILELLRKLRTWQAEGKQVTVNWFYPDPDDDDLLMEAEDFMDDAKIKMNLVSYKI